MKLTRTMARTSLCGFMLMTGFAHAGDLSEAVLSCLLEPSSEVGVSSYVSGVVKTVNVRRGDKVVKGQKLFSLESGVEQASLESARAKAEFASRKVERNKDLLEKGLLSDYEQDELLTDMKLGRLLVKEAEVRLHQRTQKSPVEGVVVRRMIESGEFVGTDPVLELATLNPLHAEVILRAEYYGQVTSGATVTLTADQLEDKVYQGKVTIVDQLIDAASGTFGIRVEVPNPDFKLPAGLKCSIQPELSGA